MVLNAIDLEVARHRFTASADEMGGVLRRTGYSPNIKERADFSTAMFVPDGELLAQAEHIPVHLGSMPASVQAVIDAFGDTLELDAQYAVNDPYHGGTHLNDLTIVRPVAHGGDLVGWVANRAHHSDVGGDAPGSMPAHATRLEQEGHVVAPMLAARAGQWVPEFLDPFLTATRTPDERLGDLSAQLGANEVGARRLVELCEAYGPAGYTAICTGLLDYGERRMRSAIGDLPDGDYSFEDFVEGPDRLHNITVRVTIDGSELHADFAGSAPQVEANFNSVEAVAVSCLYYAVRVATDPSIPANGGCYRPITMSAPTGSIVSAEPPAAVAAGNVETSQRIADALLGALGAGGPGRGAGRVAGDHEQRAGRLRFLRLLRDRRRRAGRPLRPGRPVRHPHRHDQHQEHPHREPRPALPAADHRLRPALRQRRRGPLPGRPGHRAGDGVPIRRHRDPDGRAPRHPALGSAGRRPGRQGRGLADPPVR